jgi:nucleotide-binding universal stress UspA family protein
MDQKTGTAGTQPSHFVADPEGARYESDSAKTGHHPAAPAQFLEAALPEQQSSPNSDSTPRVGRIVVGVDGSPESLRAFSRAAHLATVLNTKLEIVTAWRPFVGYAELGATDWSPERDATEIITDALGTEFGDSIPDWVSSSARQGGAAQQLIDESTGAEMLVVGSRGHGGVAGLLLGSVSLACAEGAHCPVLVVR